MGKRLTHYAEDPVTSTFAACGRNITNLHSSNFIDDVECLRCIKRLELIAEADVEPDSIDNTEFPSKEQTYLLGLMEQRLKRVGLICITEDLTPVDALKKEPRLYGSISTLGAVIQHLYPKVGYVGQTFVQKILVEEGWPL